MPDSLSLAVDKSVADAAQSDYDGLILPGGTVNADNLRASQDVVEFLKEYFATRHEVAPAGATA